jgi:hypothetical protein
LGSPEHGGWRTDQLISLAIPAVIGVASCYVLAGRNR